MKADDTCIPVERIYLYTRFERFWHWAQAALIVLLAATGLEVHGTYTFLGWETAATLHGQLGITWLVLYVFILFWQFTTGEWKHYIPTTRMLMAVIGYYLHGIFRGEPHPVPKTERNKHNPLQRLTYLGISLLLIPLQMITGLLYYLYNRWPELGIHMDLGSLAIVHTAGAFALLVFLIVHIYMTTTGHSLTCHLLAMCTGWEDVPRPGAQGSPATGAE